MSDLKTTVRKWKENHQKIVFTNGCFDLVHRGHVEVLAKISDLGDKLVVGLNSDFSIQKIKGKQRPIVDEHSRSLLLASIQFIDAIVIFDDSTPLNLIDELNPDILAKGGDYNIQDIVGHDIVVRNGGKVTTIPLVKGFSSTDIINHIRRVL